MLTKRGVKSLLLFVCSQARPFLLLLLVCLFPLAVSSSFFLHVSHLSAYLSFPFFPSLSLSSPLPLHHTTSTALSPT